MDRSTFECRAASDLEESILVLEALFTVALGDVQRNRLGPSQPLVTGRSIHSGQSGGDVVRKRNLLNRKTINVQTFVVESRLGHRGPFEYEYEYSCTEYEYDLPDERDGSGIHRVVHRLEKNTEDDQALARRLKALMKQASSVTS